MAVDRGLLPYTFGAWFQRFSSLTEVQELGIPPIVAGRDVLICSPTASGKTEAYAAPAAELVRRQGGPSACAMFVTPTRALANDLKRRLEGPMALVDVSLGRYTGEHKERVGGELPSVVIVTPEGLDSMIARHPARLRELRFVVLDEIHVLDGTPRGDQVRVLLHRLEAVALHRPQRIAASATVDRPNEMGARYLEDPAIIVVGGSRRILGRAFEGREPGDFVQHLDFIGSHGYRKVLVFCRSRNQVENLAAKTRGRTRFGDAVHAHHGSLGKRQRERTERLFLQEQAAVCFATLTLEMGIDIGTVDYVLLASLPADVPSLLQRIGRGGRRGETTRCGYVYEDVAQRFIYEAMFRLGKSGRLCAPPYGFRPSVLVQQALVLASAGAYMRVQDLEEALPPSVRAELGAGAAQEIVDCMVEEGLLERSGADRYVPSERVEERFQKGTLHSNFSDPARAQVVDRLTGDIVGFVYSAGSKKIELGGRSRKIVKSDGVRILTDASGGAEPAVFRTDHSPSVSYAFGRAVVEELGVASGSIGWMEQGGAAVVLHGFGTFGALFLADVWKAELGSGSVDKCGPYTLRLSCPPEELPCPDDECVEAFLDGAFESLKDLIGAGLYAGNVPAGLMQDSIRSITGLEAVAAELRGMSLQPLEGLSLRAKAVLREL